ncbi:hypothetical protein L202_04531 [Cryptococcus amylolentus CBS 6039]|uniref:Uncharacterized protein n=1 Tax=Cryptococcus amylolentus CBS 6039 TaxID=1295533 RepID=A0A1E3HTL0_9TREE|nr:hypothetical protein L202_04531 [Cryptococcus amylolentus CBS 6039]ODN79026.1 hypothetical protein L202_04531 [Cryptococcus amylolentus CBS 6039]
MNLDTHTTMPASENQSTASIRDEIFDEDPAILTQDEKDAIAGAFGNGPAEGTEADDGTQNGGTEASQSGGQ